MQENNAVHLSKLKKKKKKKLFSFWKLKLQKIIEDRWRKWLNIKHRHLNKMCKVALFFSKNWQQVFSRPLYAVCYPFNNTTPRRCVAHKPERTLPIAVAGSCTHVCMCVCVSLRVLFWIENNTNTSRYQRWAASDVMHGWQLEHTSSQIHCVHVVSVFRKSGMSAILSTKSICDLWYGMKQCDINQWSYLICNGTVFPFKTLRAISAFREREHMSAMNSAYTCWIALQ